VRQFGSCDWPFDHHMVNLVVVFWFLPLFWKSRLEPSVIVLMVLMVGKLLLCCEGSRCCAGGGGSVLGSIFGWIVWVLVVGYVIYNSCGG
jgi:hypothetical protein